jgi:hypothetical protein
VPPFPPQQQQQRLNLRILKMQFLSQQHRAWEAHEEGTMVQQCADFYAGRSAEDPDDLLTAFVKFAEKAQ